MNFRICIGLAGVLLAPPAFGQDTPPGQLDLDAAIKFGAEHSLALSGARAEVDAARAETGAVRARRGPQVSANAFASKGNMPNVLSSGMGVEPQALVLTPDKPFTDVNLTLMVPLYTGGRLEGASIASSARERAAQAELEEMKAEVTLNVRATYMRVLLEQELLKAQQSRVEAAEAMVRNAQAQVEVGKAIQASVQRAQAELADAQRELTDVQNERDKATLDLLEAMGAKLDSPVTLTSSLQLSSATKNLDDYLIYAMRNRGSLVASAERVRAARAGLSSARGAQGPQVFGFAMGDSFTPRDEMGKSSGYTLGLNLSLPLLDAGMRSSEVSASGAMVRQAEAQQAAARLAVEKQVRAAWLDYGTAQANYTNAQAALQAAQSAYDVMVLRVENGKSILVEQLDALAALTRARANVSQATFDQQIALANLDRAAGISYPIPTGGNL